MTDQPTNPAIGVGPDPVTYPRERPAGCPFDPPPELARLRATAPVTRMVYPDGHIGWLVTSHAAAREVLTDPRFSVRPDLRHSPIGATAVTGGSGPPPPGMFADMDRPEHTRYRRLLTGQFTVHRMRQLEPRITRIVGEHLDAMAATMATAGPTVDLVSAFALPIPSLAICELLGVNYDDHEMFQEHATTLVTPDTNRDRGAAALGALTGYLRKLVARKRAHCSDDLLGRLAAEGELTDEELTNIALLLLVAGHETTANMLALGVFALLQHPDQLAALRAEPDLAETAVEELLRYLSILQLGVPTYRAALEDVQLDGQLVRAGETATIALPAANRDPQVFPDPDTLTIDRDNARHHLGFGHGIHQCLGQQLARIEMRIAFPALFGRFPTLRLAIPAAEVPLREAAVTYGVWRLPVTWDTAVQAE